MKRCVIAGLLSPSSRSPSCFRLLLLVMDQPRHLEVRRLSEEEFGALQEAAPAIESLLVNRGTADINSDSSRLGDACEPFFRLVCKRQPEVTVSVSTLKKIEITTPSSLRW